MAVTIYDVAKRAGVGIGTVSRVLNGSPQVRDETRQRVLAAIEELNYRPSPIAQRLSLRKTLTIAVIAPFFTRPAFVERLRGVEATIAESEYDLIVYNVETTDKRDACFHEVPLGHKVDGVLIISLSPGDDDVARWQETGVPVVLVDAYHPALSCVVVDDVAGGYMATRHLIELGHRRIAYISDPLVNPFNFTSSRDRYTGYRQALADHDIPFRPAYHQQGEHGRAQARLLTHNLLNLDDPPTAIFAASDTQALGVMEALRERGLRAPDDVAVIGYDDIEVAEYLELSTVRQPFFKSGTLGVELLLKHIDDPQQPPQHVELPVELIARRTTVG
ncbi:MAG: LacI family DNA-binding transcriptional regulator [Ardenticatenia bacterium]|nr:LacI family DNA-binding transcriptional regulator [Ardenticatenia bacterium]